MEHITAPKEAGINREFPGQLTGQLIRFLNYLVVLLLIGIALYILILLFHNGAAMVAEVIVSAS